MNDKLKMPIRTEGLVMYANGYEPAIKDYQTGEAQLDTKSGLPLFKVNTTVILPGAPRGQMWSIKVPGEPKGLQPGTPVGFSNLQGTEWEMDDGSHGIGFRAESISYPGQSSGSKSQAA